MKRNFTIVFATLLAIVIFQTNSLRLQSNTVQPPNGGLANDPGQTNCTHCHTTYGAAISRNSQFVIRVSPDSAGLASAASVVTSSSTYTPNFTQWVSIELLGVNTNSPGFTPKFGFQFTALKAAPNDSMAGSFTLIDGKTSMETSAGSISPAMYGPVSYVGHRNADTTHIWYFKWTAPDSLSGPVTFYYSGNLANGNPADQPDPQTLGDSIFTGSVTLNPGQPLGIDAISGNIHYASVYPVPFGQQLSADLYMNAAADVSLTLLSIDGQAIRQLYSGAVAQGHFSRSFEIEGLASGVYLVRVQSGADSHVIKVLKY